MNDESSVLMLHEWLLEAAETERRLPAGLRTQAQAAWPDVMAEGDFRDVATRVSLAKATADQIDRYDCVLRWITAMPDAADRSLLWAAAHSAAFRSRGPRWSKLARLLYTNRATVKRRYEAALLRLWAMLNLEINVIKI